MPSRGSADIAEVIADVGRFKTRVAWNPEGTSAASSRRLCTQRSFNSPNSHQPSDGVCNHAWVAQFLEGNQAKRKRQAKHKRPAWPGENRPMCIHWLTDMEVLCDPNTRPTNEPICWPDKHATIFTWPRWSFTLNFVSFEGLATAGTVTYTVEWLVAFWPLAANSTFPF